MVIDADGHVVESVPEFAELGWEIRPTGDATLDRIFNLPDDLKRLGLCADAAPWDPQGRIGDMDREGIDVSINYPTALLLVNQIAAEVATGLCRVYNDWAHSRFTVPTGGRVRTMALVCLTDPEEAVREARRAVVDLGAPGITVSPFAGDRHLDDPALDPLWALAEALDVAVGVHGGRATTAPHLVQESFVDQRRYYAMAHPFGQMVALGDMTIGGVFDRHPGLRVAFLESGVGWVRWYADRLDAGWESVREEHGAPRSERRPTEYVYGGNCFFSCEPDEPDLRAHIAAIGADRVVFASDYPHFDCKFPDSVTALRNAGLPDAALHAITTTTPTSLYALT